ncbi:hypothetical protein KA005_61205, partial [bacterium]|nr:hypothetical protein [bacterium]
MILPTKHINHDRALLSIGAEILRHLSEPKTVSRLWDDLRIARNSTAESSSLAYDWFVLALDLLYILNTIK